MGALECPTDSFKEIRGSQESRASRAKFEVDLYIRLA